MYAVQTGCWFVGGDDFDWSLACLIASIVTTTSIILTSNKIQNGDVLVSANPDPSGKWPLKHRGRVNIAPPYQFYGLVQCRGSLLSCNDM